MTTAEDYAVDSSYATYPPSQPFIYDDYRRDPSRPITAYPESNRQAILSALRNLQEKMTLMELERSVRPQVGGQPQLTVPQVEGHPRSITHKESNEGLVLTPGYDQRGHAEMDPVYRGRTVPGTGDMTTPRRDIDESLVERHRGICQQTEGSEVYDKLETAERRCRQLEGQLEYMRQLVSASEHGRNRVLRKSARLRAQDSEQHGLGDQLLQEKIQALEREQLHLLATGTLAKNKIRELNEKLVEERYCSETMRREALEAKKLINAQLSRDAATWVRKVPSRKKNRGMGANKGRGSAKQQNKKSHSSVPGRHQEPIEHYKINLSDLPFVNGKSVGESYSLNANLQQVMSLIKQGHNPRLCRNNSYTAPGGATHHRRQCCSKENTPVRNNMAEPPVHESSEHESSRHESTERESNETAVTRKELDELLLQLQDELGTLSFEREDLVRQTEGRQDDDELQQKLAVVLHRIETKADQITLLRRYQHMMERQLAGKHSGSRGNVTAHKNHQPVSPTTARSPEVRITALIKGTRDKGSSNSPSAGDSSHSPSITISRAQSSLQLFKELKKLQATLRCDDISWDC